MIHEIRSTAQKIARRLDLIAGMAYRRSQPLGALRFTPLANPSDTPPMDPALDDSDWELVQPHSYWGGFYMDFALRARFTVPAEFDPELPTALYLPLGKAGDFSHPEAQVYLDGGLYANADRHHQEVLLPVTVCDGQEHVLGLHGWEGLLDANLAEPNRKLYIQTCALVQIDPPTREFITAARVALQTADLLDENHPAKARLYNALDDAFRVLDTREPMGDGFYASVPAALAVLRNGIAAAGEPLDAEIIAAGHAHIDVAWLWSVGQTRRKAARTFSNVLRLMEQFPAYCFTQSQPQLYDFIRQDQPELYEGIRARIAEGRWEPIGGMWVEADCNITGAESLARQFLLGRSFFCQQFGPQAESPVLWLPDVFGYSWSLPQLIKLAGLEYFFTIKIGWNRVNKLPFDSFWWQGLDGTRVLTHFSTTPDMPWDGKPDLRNSATYNANITPFAALGSWVNLKHKESQRVMLMSYGYGDGGGGPTREMNENAVELAAFPGMPQVKQGLVRDFFRRLESESGAKLPVWNAELYLEIHRGTYTTQSRNKRANRKSEFLLHDAEFLAAWAVQLDDAFEYPAEVLHGAWETVCLNQFHDIIPGSSVQPVYIESQMQYAALAEAGRAVRDSALTVVAAHTGGDVVVVNPTGFEREDLAWWDGTLAEGERFAGDVYTQFSDGGTLIGGLHLAPYSAQGLERVQGEPACPDPAQFGLSAAADCLENAFLRVEINAAGDITRAYDKQAQREVLPPGGIANQFQAFEDRPLDWDAWDVDIFYDDKLFLSEPADSIRVVEQGPLRATVEVQRRILNNAYRYKISLCWNRAQIDFDTTIDWRERHIFLKTAFPVDVLSPLATHEIQWGSVQRPTHRNTSWDWARFETCAQKWVDLSEGGYGAALLNDCKYGHDIQGQVMRISLLRSPTEPDPTADLGEHHFAYSFMPHSGGCNPYAIARPAYALNDPLLAVSNLQPSRASARGLLAVDEGVIIETVKRAEDGRGMIVRLYECNRCRGPVTLRAGFKLASAHITNLLEDDQEALVVDDNRVRLHLRPFQIVTLRLEEERTD